MKGHLWLTLDKHYPNKFILVFIRIKNLSNFEYDVKQYFGDKSNCVVGKVDNFSDAPSITLNDQRNIA